MSHCIMKRLTNVNCLTVIFSYEEIYICKTEEVIISHTLSDWPVCGEYYYWFIIIHLLLILLLRIIDLFGCLLIYLVVAKVSFWYWQSWYHTWDFPQSWRHAGVQDVSVSAVALQLPFTRYKRPEPAPAWQRPCAQSAPHEDTACQGCKAQV